MSDTITLKASVREAGKGLQTLRKSGFIPGSVHGHGIEPTSLSLESREFTRAFKAAGENTIIALTIDGAKPVNVLVKEAQMHPLTNRYTHADFFQVRMDEVIEATVPFEFVGDAAAVSELGGVLIKASDEIDVNALPADLPHTIQIDLSALKTFDDVIKVGDLVLPKGVTVDADVETVIALVEAPRTTAEIEALDEKVEADVTKVEKAGKPAEESTEEAGK
ncbi:MAG: 50S ribosomal protein L25 [Candidatus Moranbacteria bacterium]|nr:50S ribosomal protein L25 [Candidatus Moranbacteria bacterium]